ncbi:MAG: hypothetical protein KAX78_04405 [Phycisphaerae bacterium]|nr:hypothetical protein [Phycisphaerae bacterium]
MLKSKNKQRPEDKPPGPGAWLVTFSDCMTLLLCFFVLLLTFSSFDEMTLNNLANAFRSRSDRKATVSREKVERDSMVEPVNRPLDRTEAGSEMQPQETELGNVRNPRKSTETVDTDDAYKDRQVFYVSSNRVFWGKGTVLSPAGRKLLNKIAKLMKLVPSQVTIGVSRPDQAKHPDAPNQQARTVIQYLVKAENLDSGRFCIANIGTDQGELLDGAPFVRITLLARNLCK